MCKKMGRPKVFSSAKLRQIYMPDDLAEVARQLGNGNISMGVRLALELAKNIKER